MGGGLRKGKREADCSTGYPLPSFPDTVDSQKLPGHQGIVKQKGLAADFGPLQLPQKCSESIWLNGQPWGMWWQLQEVAVYAWWWFPGR